MSSNKIVLLNDMPMRGEESPLKGISINNLEAEVVRLNAVPRYSEDKKERTSLAKGYRKELQAQLSALQPKCIIPLGPLAVQAALNLNRQPNFANYRGSISVIKWKDNRPEDVTKYRLSYPVSSDCTYIMPVLSPWFVRRAPEWTDISRRDIDRVRRVLHNGWIPYEYRKGIELFQCTNNLDYLALDFDDTVALDIESTEDPPHLCKLICLVISDTTKSAIIPYSRTLDGRSPHWSDESYFRDSLNKFLTKHVAVTHNGPCFDHIALHRYGINVPHWEDTIVASHVLEGHMRKNLYEACSRYLDIWPWKQHDHSTMEELFAYNATDGVNTILLWNELKERLGY